MASEKPKLLEQWIFVGLMNMHLPILQAALESYIKSGKIPPKYKDATMVLLYILTSAIERAEGKDDDHHW